nr:MAG TPA: hypothetical protein [Caudoviricetes sp.]
MIGAAWVILEGCRAAFSFPYSTMISRFFVNVNTFLTKKSENIY